MYHAISLIFIGATLCVLALVFTSCAPVCWSANCNHPKYDRNLYRGVDKVLNQ